MQPDLKACADAYQSPAFSGKKTGFPGTYEALVHHLSLSCLTRVFSEKG